MNITEYIASLETIVYSLSIINDSHLSIDRKAQDIAFISGWINFIDGSRLDFKEFVESTEQGIERYKYGYNYRFETEVIIRYDNAADPRARKLYTFPHHKHIENGKIIESSLKTLTEILEEIEDCVLNRLIQNQL